MVPVMSEITKNLWAGENGVVWKQSENHVRNANSPLSGQIEFDFSTDMRFKT